MLLAALAVARSWFADRSWTVAVWAAVGAGIIAGLGAGRLVLARLAFHGFDGLLAADALHPESRRRYMAACHGVGAALLAAVTLIVRPSLLMVTVPAYLGGVSTAGLTSAVRTGGNGAAGMRPGRIVRAWLRRPAAGCAGAMILLSSLLPVRTLEAGALVTIVGGETVLLAVALTVVDDATVRFMTLAGHGSGRIVLRHARAMAMFVGIALPGCWLALGPIAASVVGAASTVMLLLLAMRVLAYRLHRKRFADCLVSILAGLLMLAAYATPLLVPFVVAAVLWQLQRRSGPKTWLLA